MPEKYISISYMTHVGHFRESNKSITEAKMAKTNSFIHMQLTQHIDQVKF